MINYPFVTKIIETVEENQTVKTIRFDHPADPKPGQFYMIWIPGVDEIPMSVSYTQNPRGITFKKVGKATKKLFNFKKGEKIGIRGPYGTSFKIIKEKKILFVAGGTGIATITPTVELAVAKGVKSTVILGAKTKKELFFEKRLKKLDVELYVTTDDGSKGYKGLATDLAEDILSRKKFNQVLTCGPEIMMKKLLELCKKTDFQASLERYMKCGFGLCGQCCIGTGLRVCREGPVFDGETLSKISDFGLYKKDATGKKVKI